MTIVSIKEARSKIGLLIEKAEHGEEILITRRGKKSRDCKESPKRAQNLRSKKILENQLLFPAPP